MLTVGKFLQIKKSPENEMVAELVEYIERLHDNLIAEVGPNEYMPCLKRDQENEPIFYSRELAINYIINRSVGH